MNFFQIIIMALSMLSLNCNGLRDQAKRRGLVQWLQNLPVSVDVVCLQETHCILVSESSSWFQSSGFSSAVSPGSVHSCGCIVLFRSTLTLVNSWGDADGRFCNVNFCLVPSYLVCAVFMGLIATLHGINSWTIFMLGLIPQYQLSWLVISIRCLIVLWIVLARTPLIRLVRALPLC